MIEQELDQCLV